MKKYIKNCPNCGSVQQYKSSSALWLSIKNNSTCKKCSALKNAKKLGDASFLLDDTLISYYWIGFILADGHISNNRLSIGLSAKDINHLEKLAKLLGVKVRTFFIKKYNICSLSCMDTMNISKLVEKYDIKGNKTENPPNISNISEKNMIALSIGFIDGDGSIKNVYKRQDFSIIIKCHKSWLNNLKLMYGKSYITNSGYATCNISNSIDCKRLKRFAIQHNLPILERKWNIINLAFKSKQEASKEKIEIIKKMIEENKSRKDMKKITGLSDSGICVLIKKITYDN